MGSSRISVELLRGKGSEIANKVLRDRVEQMSKVPTPKDLETLKSLQRTGKCELYRTLGLDPMPPRTPLHARITGFIQRDGYRIEKLAFESRPNWFVTAHVYVPEPSHPVGGTRWPVIMNVNGHWHHKKDEPTVQLRCAFQALRGFLAIVVDSPGFSFEGDSLIERRAEGTHHDFAMVEGGTNTTGYYVWDTMRALDYLATRKDCDMGRVGITGASGGGLATLYAFAADDRYKAAASVVYMSSMEVAPDNGCECNHVPGTLQIGDRSDVAAIQAPKPFLLIGAEQDGEFTPEGMRLTHEKMAKTWDLSGHGDDVKVKIFPGGHDYSRPMRETVVGFFEKYLLHKGDGSPIPEPGIKTFNPEDHSVLVLDPPVANERTMRDLARESLSKAPTNVSVVRAIAANGGIPAKTPTNPVLSQLSDEQKALVFESEPGLKTPAFIFDGPGVIDKLTIYLSDGGKDFDLSPRPPNPGPGERQVFMDVLGTGELSRIDLRYLWYQGRSVAFTGGWQIVQLVEALHAKNLPVRISAWGPLTSQSAMWAALMRPMFVQIDGHQCLTEWSDVFQPGMMDYAVQPRANLCGSLQHLRSLVKNAIWDSIK